MDKASCRAGAKHITEVEVIMQGRGCLAPAVPGDIPTQHFSSHQQGPSGSISELLLRGAVQSSPSQREAISVPLQVPKMRARGSAAATAKTEQ